MAAGARGGVAPPGSNPFRRVVRMPSPADLAAMAEAWRPSLRRASALSGAAEHALLALAAATGDGSAPPWASALPADQGKDGGPALLAAAVSPGRGPAFAAAHALRHDPAAWLRALHDAGWPARDPNWADAAVALLDSAAAAVLAGRAGAAPAALTSAPLDAASVARLAAARFPADAAATMVAIAMAVSGLDPLAAGESFSAYAERDLVRRLSAAAPSAARPLPGAGEPPYTAFGLWQIRMPLTARILVRLTGTADPAAWALWLLDPGHNADVARQVWDGRQKFAAWPAFAQGAHRPHLAAAAEAVAGVS